MQEQKKSIIRCSRCGTKKVWKSGFAFRISGKVQVYQCKKCGHKFRVN